MSQLNSEQSKEYLALPEPIKSAYSEKEYLWLSVEEKKNILVTECEPDVIE